MGYRGSLTASLVLRNVFFKYLDSVKALQAVHGRYLFLGIDLWILIPLQISSHIKH